MAIFGILRAVFGYLFFVLMVRVVGRRPGKQLTPFEFVLIFYLGGLTLTGMVGNEASLTNAFTQVLTVASATTSSPSSATALTAPCSSSTAPP